MSSDNKTPKKKLDWAAVLFLFLLPFVAIGGTIFYTIENGFHWFDIVLFFSFYYFSGLGITGGYHRYFSHKAYQCHPLMQLFYLIGGAIAVQRSCLTWCIHHRKHHQHVDTPEDPYNINQGFYYSHMGWIMQQADEKPDLTGVSDLLKNKLVMWQHKYYWAIVAIFAAGLPTLLGALVDRPFGGLLWGGFLRLLVVEHATYSVNSVAHTFGAQTYSLDTTARDSLPVALLTNGEGYHSFHHRFASDYRNGVKWYHWDPTKWHIKISSWFGLTKNLKAVSDMQILKAKISTDMEKIKRSIKNLPQDVSAPMEKHLIKARKNVEELGQRWTSAKEQFKLKKKNMAKNEILAFKQKLRTYKQEFNLAHSRWGSLVASILVTGQHWS